MSPSVAKSDANPAGNLSVPHPTNAGYTFRSSSLAAQGGSSERIRRGLPSYHPQFRSLQTSSEPRLRQSKFTTAFYGWKYVLASWFNLLLFCMPASWATNIILKRSHGIIFVLCIIALIPLVRLHDIATRELVNRIGGAKTGLLNGSMSNFVEIVVAISALRKCELRVVQSMLVGSMLSKLLLVLGLCFLAGGMKFSEQDFDPTATQVHSSLLSLSVGAVVLPAAYHFTLDKLDTTPASIETQRISILKMSHAVSIVLLFIYLAYLLFQLWSHTHLYRDQQRKSNRLSATIRENKRRHKTDSQRNIPLTQINAQPSILLDTPSPDRCQCHFIPSPWATNTATSFNSHPDQTIPGTFPRSGGVALNRESTYTGSTTSGTSFLVENNPYEQEHSPTEILPQREPQMSWFLTISLLIMVTAAVAVTVDLLVTAMDEISPAIRKEWVGLILLPAISSVAECITAVKVSVKDELTLSVGVAVGSTIQTALFVIPLTVILGWITRKPLSLLMDPFQSMVLYLAVNTMGYVVADGKSNWLDGVILICLYIIIAVSFWFYPGSDLLNSLSACIVKP